MQKTRRGVCMNLKESDYVCKVGNFEFYFSSPFYLKKFADKYDEYIKIESYKFAYKYKVTINFAMIFLLSFYKQIEKRGFYVKYLGAEISKEVLFFGEIWK